MKHRILITAISCMTLFATAVTPAFAETTTTTQPQSRQIRIEATKQRACERITTKVSNQRDKIDERAAAIQKRFENQDTRLAKIKDKANERGIDTTDLRNYMDIWSGYTNEIKSKRNEISSTIDSAVSAICEGDRAGGRAAFDEAKVLVDEMKEVRLSRRQYWLDTIVPELKSIRDELRGQRI